MRFFACWLLALPATALAQPTPKETDEAWMKEAIEHYDGGRYQRAMRCLDSALARNDHAQLTDILYYYRAAARLQLNDPQGARQDLDSAIAHLAQPKAHYYYQRGLCHLQLQAPDRAEADFLATTQTQAGHYEAFTQLGILDFKRRRFPQALERFQTAIALDPDFAEAYYYRGFVYFQLLQPQKACADLRTAAELEYAPAQAAIKQYCK